MTTENKVKVLLMKVGVDPSVKGFDYLVEAIKMCYEDKNVLQFVTTKLYPHIAGMFDTTPSRVERAMRHATAMIDENNPRGFDVLPFVFTTRTIPNSRFIGVCVEYLKIHEEE